MDKNELQTLLSTAIYNAGRALMMKAAKWLAIGYFIIVAIGWFSGDFDRDSTDGAKRSGLKLHTDAQTGCQYLSTAGGGVTPRISAGGQHYGCKQLIRVSHE